MSEHIEAALINQPCSVEQLLKAAQKPFQENIELDSYGQGYRPVVFVPTGYKAEYPDFESKLAAPLRKTGTVTLADTESFNWYLKEHGEAHRTRIYLEADYEAGKVEFTALLNDHQADIDSPAWRDHIAKFSPKKSVEWNRWVGNNKQAMSQNDFASFLEDNLTEIAELEGLPTASQLMEMALNFEATSEKRFKSHSRLQSGGIQFEFVDQEDDATRQKMSIFERFAIGIPVFAQPLTESDQIVAYRIDARIKYRIRDGKLTFWYELVRTDKVLKKASEDIVGEIKTGSGFPILAGKAF
ncbi:DUF2303 family protein [Chitinibacter sp. GC72]|uniref:DUF2303 family protein n=1 Tax=Chitinibacter sp. GC72 TaxID=1526917 RepID=UPI0012FB4A2A|nr:DUF2303 family protein [Chitinibacter sp. GC72]